MGAFHLVVPMIVNGEPSNMATRHCSENSGKICRITQTKTLPRKGKLLGIFKYCYLNKMFKRIKNFLSIYFNLLLPLSCSTVLDGVYTWDSFIQERSYDGDTFFAEAKAPNGIISYGSSNDSQGAASNMASRHCSENSGKICKITRLLLCRKNKILSHWYVQKSILEI